MDDQKASLASTAFNNDPDGEISLARVRIEFAKLPDASAAWWTKPDDIDPPSYSLPLPGKGQQGQPGRLKRDAAGEAARQPRRAFQWAVSGAAALTIASICLFVGVFSTDIKALAQSGGGQVLEYALAVWLPVLVVATIYPALQQTAYRRRYKLALEQRRRVAAALSRLDEVTEAVARVAPGVLAPARADADLGLMPTPQERQLRALRAVADEVLALRPRSGLNTDAIRDWASHSDEEIAD